MIDTFLTKIKTAFEVIESKSVIESILSTLADESVSDIDIPAYGDSICPVSGQRIPVDELTGTELDELISLTRRLSTEASGGAEACDFDVVLKPISQLPDIVLDGANIAHVNQNFVDGYFRFDQIKDIYDHFKGGLGLRCLVVLHTKWLSEDRDLRLFLTGSDIPTDGKRVKKRKKPALPQLGSETLNSIPIEADVEPEPLTSPTTTSTIVRPVPMDMINTWRENHELLEIPHKQNDDWFWMHVCCLSIKDRIMSPDNKSNVMLVSNDLMRDHIWRMQNPRSFTKFVKNHVCRYTIQFGEDGINQYNYMHPPNHSICMHRSVVRDEIVWHIPYHVPATSSVSDFSDIRWLVIRLK